VGGVGLGKGRDGGIGDEGNIICPNTFGPILPIISTVASTTNTKIVVMVNLAYFFNRRVN
jgi:hypothetical protein